MLDDIAGMGDNPRAQYFALGQLQALEQMIFVLVARVRGFEAERTGVDLKHIHDDLREVCFVQARAFVDRVAGMKAYPVRSNSCECCVGCFDVDVRASLLLSIVQPRLNEDVWQKWIVYLQQ